jgi:NADPH:quinone reductase-like Zn-dependent oxidoreductase
MRQVVIFRYGRPEVLEVREAPDPVAGEGEVRIAVRTAGVNFADVLARVGLYPDAPKPPAVIGYEVAGVVDAVGAGVTRVHPGDRVTALTHFGGYATSVVAPEASVFAVPGGVSDAEAAALPVNYLTALVALYRLANIAPGETVLIHGAAGGVGVAATQLANLRRATIVGTASAAKHDALRAFGVHLAIDPRVADVAREVMAFTGGRGVDVVLDPIGGRSFETSYRLLAPLGRLVLYGVSAVAPGERSLMNHNRGVFGLHLGRLWGEQRQLAAGMQLLLQELESGRLRPVVARTFPLERAGEAHRFLQSRASIGKVVLTCPGGNG